LQFPKAAPLVARARAKFPFRPKRAGKGEFSALAAEKRENPRRGFSLKSKKIGDAKSTSVFVAL